MAPQGPIGRLWIAPDGTTYRAHVAKQKEHSLLRIARNRHRNQKHYAASRGIDFDLTFEQWWKVWQDSGHWRKRGPLPHQYCMARGTTKRPDVGPYKLGNVRIITNRKNREEQGMDYMFGNKHALGSKHTEEWKQQASIRKIGNTYAAVPWTKKEKKLISKRTKESWELRRRKYGPSGRSDKGDLK